MKYLLLFLLLASQASLAGKVDLNTDKISTINGIINEDAARTYYAQTLATLGLKGPHVVYIDSLGGELNAGQIIIDIMEREKAHGVKLVCVVGDEATSMAFNILTHCDVRLAHSESRFLIHKAAFGGIDPNLRLTAKNLHWLAYSLERDDEPYRRANCKAMHLTLAEYDNYTDTEKTWSTVELIRLGYIQGIVK